MIKKALTPLALVLAIVLLAWKFFTVEEVSKEQLDPFLVVPSNTIAMDIHKEVEGLFLDHSIAGKTYFICNTFPEHIASCIILNDSLQLDSTDLNTKLKIDNIYSSDTIFSLGKELFFVSGRKVYTSTNAVLIQQILLKIQKNDLLQLDPNMEELKALTQESKNVLVSLSENQPFLVEYNDINESATGYSFSQPNSGSITGTALNFIPPNASQFSISQNTLQFNWENISFTISKADSVLACSKKYRDARICSTDSLTSAFINGLEIMSSNESATNNLLDMFYENKGLQNIKKEQNINWIKQVSALDFPALKLTPKFIQKGIFLSYESQKELKIWHVLSSNQSVQRSANDPGEFEVNFSEPIVYGPYAVKNHRSKTPCIMVQTADHVLYYLNSNGKILWKTTIDGEILGKPVEVDRFRNNKIQYVFNTNRKLYQIDILGRSVSGFPKRLNCTAPPLLVKYKAKKERLLVPVGKRLKNYLLDGEKTKGWSEITLDGDIKNIAYKKIKSLDCILASTASSAYILNPRGQKRGTQKSIPFKNSVSKIASNSAFANVFYLNEEGHLHIGNTNANKAEKFSEDTFSTLVDLGNYIYAVGNMQLVLLTQDGDLVENKFLNEKPWVANNSVLYNDGEFYSLFIAPGVRCNIKSPNKALNIITLGDKIAYSESKTLHFIDRL